MCKFVYILRTVENPFGSCQPCSNNIHITYDDNTAVHRATVVLLPFSNHNKCQFLLAVHPQHCKIYRYTFGSFVF